LKTQLDQPTFFFVCLAEKKGKVIRQQVFKEEESKWGGTEE